MNRWLIKALRTSESFQDFAITIGKRPNWYGIPVTWTLKDLRHLWDNERGIRG